MSFWSNTGNSKKSRDQQFNELSSIVNNTYKNPGDNITFKKDSWHGFIIDYTIELSPPSENNWLFKKLLEESSSIKKYYEHLKSIGKTNNKIILQTKISSSTDRRISDFFSLVKPFIIDSLNIIGPEIYIAGLIKKFHNFNNDASFLFTGVDMEGFIYLLKSRVEDNAILTEDNFSVSNCLKKNWNSGSNSIYVLTFFGNNFLKTASFNFWKNKYELRLINSIYNACDRQKTSEYIYNSDVPRLHRMMKNKDQEMTDSMCTIL